MKTNLIIKGAYYYDSEIDAVLVPHFTGIFFMVDCTRYLKKKEIISRWGKDYFLENKNDFVEYEGNKYYYAEYYPFNVEGMELLSDLSELEHVEETFNF